MYKFDICFNAAKILLQEPLVVLCQFRLINTTHQFKLNKVIKYPKRDIPKSNSMKQTLLEQSNIHTDNFLTRTMERHNHYSVLGLTKNASPQEIKKAYYILARKYHPDSSTIFRSPESDRRFQEIAEAYRVLSDDRKRLEYDLYGTVKNVKKVLPDIKRLRESDYKVRKVLQEAGYNKTWNEEPKLAMITPEEATLKLTFLQSVRGTKKGVTIKVVKRCPGCSGVTSHSFTRNLVLCQECDGSGLHAATSATGHMVRGPCKVCHGRRYVPQHTCPDCNGRGIILANKEIEINVPSGVESGDIIKVPHPSCDQQIPIRILVAKNDTFSRVGNDIYSDLVITVSQAVLGGIIQAKGLVDDHNIVLEPGTESGTKIRLVGKGVKTNSDAGDHILTVCIKIPKFLTAKQRALMTAFAEMEAEEPDQKAELRKSKIKDELITLHSLNSTTSAGSYHAKPLIGPTVKTFKRFYRTKSSL